MVFLWFFHIFPMGCSVFPPSPAPLCLEEVSKDLQVRQRRAKLRSPGVGRRRGKQGAHDQSDEHHGQRVVEIRFYGLRVWGWGNGEMGTDGDGENSGNWKLGSWWEGLFEAVFGTSGQRNVDGNGMGICLWQLLKPKLKIWDIKHKWEIHVDHKIGVTGSDSWSSPPTRES